MPAQWRLDWVQIADIYFTQDSMSDHFSAGWGRIDNLIQAFQGAADLDAVLGSNVIYVVPYPDTDGKLYSLDNRRLFCLKMVYPPLQMITVRIPKQFIKRRFIVSFGELSGSSVEALWKLSGSSLKALWKLSGSSLETLWSSLELSEALWLCARCTRG